MIIPQEKPYMDGLNSYYLDPVKFIEHLQGEIGNGCIYLKSSVREMLIYFDEMDIINGVIQESGRHAEMAPSLQPIFVLLQQRTYLVTVFQLDPNAIFFWAHIPPFQRAKKDVGTDKVSLSDLIDQLHKKQMSCFVEVRFCDEKKSALLFFNQGDYTGASYSWGAGGLNPSKAELGRLADLTREQKAILTIGHFRNPKKAAQKPAGEKKASSKPLSIEDQVFISNLPTILEEFFEIYVEAVKRKVKFDPIPLLEQRLVVRGDDFPFLDPFNLPFEYADGIFTFTGTDSAFGENIAKAIIACAWDVVLEYRQEKKFRSSLAKWPYKPVLEERNYDVLR